MESVVVVVVVVVDTFSCGDAVVVTFSLTKNGAVGNVGNISCFASVDSVVVATAVWSPEVVTCCGAVVGVGADIISAAIREDAVVVVKELVTFVRVVRL